MKDSLENVFEAWGRFVFRHPWPVIVAMLVFTAVPAAQLPDVKIENSVQSFLKAGDPTLLAYNDFRVQYGMDQLAVLGIETPHIFDVDFLARLRALHEGLERRVPHVDEVTSLINARFTHERGGELVVDRLLGTPPRTAEDLIVLEARVRANPLYVDTLLASSGRLVTVSVRSNAQSAAAAAPDEFDFDEDADAPGAEPEFLTDIENLAFMAGIREVAAEFDAPDFRIHVAGVPAMTERLDVVVRRDVIGLVAFSVLASAAILFLLFRSVAGVLLPLIVVGTSVLATFGWMVLLGVPLSITTVIVPSLLLVVGLCDSMHLLVITSQQLRRGASREDAIAHALHHSGLPILMTTVTTAAGLMSFWVAELAPVAYFGVVAPLGVVLALVYTVVLLPALLAVVTFQPRARVGRGRTLALLNGVLAACGDLATRRPWGVVAASAFIVVVALFGVVQLRFGQQELHWFPRDEPLRIAAHLLDDELRGVLNVEMLIDAGENEAFYDPERLRQLEEIARSNDSLRNGELYAGRTFSVTDVVKEVHGALNGDDPGSYAIPATREAVAQELLLFESADGDVLSQVGDSRLRTARVTVKVPKTDAWFYPDFLAEMGERASEIVGEGAEVQVTGIAAIVGRVMAAVVVSMATSYAIAFAVITPLMMLVVGSVSRGLLSMVPNLFPVWVVLGIMGWAGITLDGFSLMIGCIIIGLAVDDTIHFMHGYRRHFERHGDVAAAVHDTLTGTGAALLFTSLVLIAGCVSFVFGYMTIVATFGVLVAIAIAVALVADILLAPALMVLASSPRHRR